MDHMPSIQYWIIKNCPTQRDLACWIIHFLLCKDTELLCVCMEQVFFFLPSQQNTAVEQLHHVLCLLFNIEYMLSISALEIEFCVQASFSLLLILLGLILTRCIAQCLYPHWPANSSDWLALSALSENICNATHSSYMEHPS